MGNSSAPRFIGSFSLRLSGCGHEGNQSVTHCALQCAFGGAVERKSVDHGADDDTPPHVSRRVSLMSW
jgi:hypothetical protein